ncbi:hypothetical protein IFM47457_11255 [Aspergillus lentulus]|nr:hypothetical protein IFM47457_11255 [Aspergillus lentulus]
MHCTLFIYSVRSESVKLDLVVTRNVSAECKGEGAGWPKGSEDFHRNWLKRVNVTQGEVNSGQRQ